MTTTNVTTTPNGNSAPAHTLEHDAPNPVIEALVHVCSDLYRAGWAENHAGNISIRLDEDELAAFALTDDAPEVALSEPFPTLGGASFLVTAAGSAFRLLIRDPARHVGVITISEDGASYRLRWGYTDGRRPTSEFPAHLRGHVERSAVEPSTRVVLHCHPTHIVALTHVHSLDEVALTRSLWSTNSESILATPRGIGLLPWMVCGTDLIGIESAAKLRESSLVIWSCHGVLAAGSSLQDVIGTVESVEKAAQLWLMTRGEERQDISVEQLRELAAHFGFEPPSRFLA